VSSLLIDPLLPAPALERLLGAPPVALTVLAGGRNSRVYRVATGTGETLALKVYFRHPDDPRDRLGAETGAFRFLREQGVDCVPRVLGTDPEAGLGLFEFIAGARPSAPSLAELDEAAAFLVRLHQLRLRPEAGRLPPASEARFSLRAVAEQIQGRLDALRDGAPALTRFLADELEPAWAAVRGHCAGHGDLFERELEPAERTLSPSDFGFHNAIRRDGQLVFLDFEYFGWDDPAKMISDLLLHPGMELGAGARLRMAEGILAGLGQPGLRQRVDLAYPLFGIKWCLILLNEFLAGPLDRRRFAAPGQAIAERQALQLDKARQQLLRLRDHHDPFSLPH